MFGILQVELKAFHFQIKINTKMEEKNGNIHIIENIKGRQEPQTKCKQDYKNTWTFTDIRVNDKRGITKRASSDWGPRGAFLHSCK